jgi:hypothetical protein
MVANTVSDNTFSSIGIDYEDYHDRMDWPMQELAEEINSDKDGEMTDAEIVGKATKKIQLLKQLLISGEKLSKEAIELIVKS